MKLETSYIHLDSYFTYLELISSLLVWISSHHIILELITTLNRFHVIGAPLFYMVLVSILQLSLIQVSRFIFFPRRIFLQASTFSLEQHQQQSNSFGLPLISFLKGWFSPCGFSSFLSSLDKVIVKGDHSLVAGPYMHLDFWHMIINLDLKGGFGILLNPLIT